MNIIHRLSFGSSQHDARELSERGISVPASGLAVFEVSESAAEWPAVLDWMRTRGEVVDLIETQFSPEEIASADWCVLRGRWQQWHPQPDESGFGYLRATFDLADYCDACGAGKRQAAPFQMKKAPKWGRKGLLQLHWVYDEFFVPLEIWEKVFQVHGIGKRAVVDRNRRVLEDVVQLVIEDVVTIDTGELPAVRCPICGRDKYEHVSRGYFPRLRSRLLGSAAKTRAEFGSGRRAFRQIVVSSAVAQSLIEYGVMEAFLVPVSP